MTARNIFRILILSLFLIAISPSAKAHYVIKFGIYVKHLAIQKSGFLFDANFYWWMKVPINHKSIDMENPLKNIEFTNAENIETLIIEKTIVGNEYLINGSAKGTFLYEANYRNYPFDSQNLSIIVENTTDEKNKCIMLSDSFAYFKNGYFDINKIIHKGIYLEGISIKGVKIKNDDGFYNSNFGDQEANIQSTTYSRLSYNFLVERHYFSYFLKLIIPLFIIVVLSYLVFFIPSSQLEVASSLTVTALIAAVAFQITISDDIPTVGYTTSCDLIFYLSYTTIMIAMIQTIYTYNLEKKGNMKLSQIIEKIGRWALPIFYVLILCIIVLIST